MVTIIKVQSLVGGADTNAQGEVILSAILAELRRGNILELDFDGIMTATSSFANVAFVPILGEFDFDYIKKNIRIVRSTRQINDMIKGRLQKEAALTG